MMKASGSSSGGSFGGGSPSHSSTILFSSTPPRTEVSYDVLKLLPDHTDAKEIFATKCTTVEDKYRLLEARDKVLRARIPKVKVRVEFATRLYGTCLDMCPEKERYMRQFQRQLTLFEIDDDSPEVVVDHRKAIKAYSRSSADQDEPLPHDLRPGSTLEMTLTYLLHHIVPVADLNEDVLGDWYNFLWDRTRSIRKDITQQQLTDLCVVSLMEKCTRFHIHCSSRLCELDVHLFDPKLNDENLMKCLQSLEHLYDDLRRRDVKCPNEPEFRAYQIMMNLNEGDILLSVQQRPEWILKSPEVQAAIKLHHYIFSKNVVGFFRVLKSFPYMFSCISHRYFYQVRYRALTSMCRSSARRNGDVPLVLSQVQRMLGFGDDPSLEFQNFCDIHGLYVDVENDRLLYNRRQFKRPTSTVINREFYLIEAKLITTTAEAINGGPLPEDPMYTYQPHNSFDEEGFLKPGLVAGDGSTTSTIFILPKPEQRYVFDNNASNNDAFAEAAMLKTKMQGFMERKTASRSPFEGLSTFSGGGSNVDNQPKPTAATSTLFKSPFDGPSIFSGGGSSIDNQPKPATVFKPPFEGLSAFSGGGSSSFGENQPKAAAAATTSTVFKSPFDGPSIFSGGGSSSFGENQPKPATVFKSPFEGLSAFSGGVSFGENQPKPATSTTFKSPFDGLSAFSGGGSSGEKQSLFGGSSAGFGNVIMSQQPSTAIPSTSTFGNLNMPLPLPPPPITSVPSIFVSPPPVDLELLEREAKAKRLMIIDTVCHETFDKMLQKLMGQELKISVQNAVDKNIEEKKLQAKLLQKEEIRSRMSEEAMEKMIARVLPPLVSNIVQDEVQRHRWMQSVCELYATKVIESMVTTMVEPICNLEVSQQRAENERRIHQGTTILKRLKLRLILHKWLDFAKTKQLIRRIKEEQLMQDMLNFPAANPVSRSPKEMLQHFCGNGISPNIIKTGTSTKTWLDKCERAESLAEKFRNSVSSYVIELHKKSPGSNVEIQEPPKRIASEEYKRHCWKRRWSNTCDPPSNDMDVTSRFGGRKSKSPRQDLTNYYYPKKNGVDKDQECEPPSRHQYRKSEADSLLEEIRKFAEDAKKEKDNFIKSEEAIAGQLTNNTMKDSHSFSNMNGNTTK